MNKYVRIALVAGTLAPMLGFAAEPSAAFEITQFDRALPIVAQQASAERAATAGSSRDASAPYEMTQFDRTLPRIAMDPFQVSRRTGFAHSNEWGKDRVPDPYNP